MVELRGRELLWDLDNLEFPTVEEYGSSLVPSHWGMDGGSSYNKIPQEGYRQLHHLGSQHHPTWGLWRMVIGRNVLLKLSLGIIELLDFCAYVLCAKLVNS